MDIFLLLFLKKLTFLLKSRLSSQSAGCFSHRVFQLKQSAGVLLTLGFVTAAKKSTLKH